MREDVHNELDAFARSNPFTGVRKYVCLEENELRAKAHAAFYFRLLKNPTFSQKYSEAVRFSEFSKNRAFLRFENDSMFAVSGFITSRNENTEFLKTGARSISYKEALSMDIAQLANCLVL